MPIGPLLAPDRILRTSDAFRLVLFDRLSAAERQRVSGLCRDPDFYGVLRPQRGGAWHVVDRDMALLLLTLQEPGPVPSYVLGATGASPWRRQLAALVLDGVLEVADGEGFVTGADALPMIAAQDPPSAAGRIASLSRRAVRWAASLAGEAGRTERAFLVRRLYDFHRLPLSPAWAERLATRRSVERFLATCRPLPDGWRRRPPELSDGWLAFERSGSDRPDAGPFKLYISPHPTDLPRAVDALFSVLGSSRAAAVKLAGTAGDMLRPDKLMVYTDRFEAIYDLAQKLLPRLGDVAAHGVPFSAEIGGEGVLSWGVDRHGGGGAQSWRAWLIGRVASALERALADPGSHRLAGQLEQWPAWVQALERLRLDGIDVDRWHPTADLWGRSVN